MTNLDIKYQWQSQIALLIASAVLTLMLVSSVKANEETTSPKSLSIIAADDIVLGNKEAQIILIEYFSTTCHHCSSIHQKIFPTLKEKYIDTGKIAYVMREFIGNKQDLDASILARCNGNKDQYFKIIETVSLIYIESSARNSKIYKFNINEDIAQKNATQPIS